MIKFSLLLTIILNCFMIQSSVFKRNNKMVSMFGEFKSYSTIFSLLITLNTSIRKNLIFIRLCKIFTRDLLTLANTLINFCLCNTFYYYLHKL